MNIISSQHKQDLLKIKNTNFFLFPTLINYCRRKKYSYQFFEFIFVLFDLLYTIPKKKKKKKKNTNLLNLHMNSTK